MKKDAINKLLHRQLKRKLGKDFEIPADYVELVKTISQSYDHFERDRKIIERAMEVSSEELRDYYGKLVIQKELENKNSELENFVSMASHDLKAPLRTIFSFAALLKKELAKTELTDRAKEYLDFITKGSKGMDALIQNLLEYAKAGAPSATETEVDLNQILIVARTNLNALLLENQATIHYQNLPTVRAIPHQMLQLFQNLIGNAVKFKKPNVLPIIDLKVEENDDEFVFGIEDNGIGISEAGQSKVFEAFSRLEGGKHFEGTGLGLSICKSIVEKMNGKIWLTSKLGVGTTFWFSIPKIKIEETLSIKDIRVEVI